MQIILESIEELKDICSLIGTKVPFIGESGQAKPEVKVDVKTAAEKTKKDKTESKKEEQPKAEDKKNETPNVEVEVTGVDKTPTEKPKDAEATGENKESETVTITKEMVRAICSKAIKAGKSAEVKNIVSKYGASKLPELKEEHYADAYKDVEALL